MEALSNGRIAMMVGYSYDYRTFSENTYNASRVMYFPVLDNDISDYGAYLPSANRVLDGLMISSDVENVETAVQLATTFRKLMVNSSIILEILEFLCLTQSAIIGNAFLINLSMVLKKLLMMLKIF